MNPLFKVFLAVVIFNSCSANKEELRGTITYKTDGDTKSDSGAHIYLIREGVLSPEQIKMLADWESIRSLAFRAIELEDTLVSDSIDIHSRMETRRALHHTSNDFDTMDINSLKSIHAGEKALALLVDSLNGFGLTSRKNFFIFAKNSFELIDSVTLNPEAIKTTADSNGIYSINASLGKYYTLIACNSMKERTLYKRPLYFFQPVEITSNNGATLNHLFAPNFTKCYECLSSQYYW